ncbi:ARID DNA-binding domain-containing protein [Cladochytrium replicatum]|nr:ARID DNA-binding domain-containing protein [Cladochytrium replicatum]
MPADRDADLDSNGTPPPGSEADSYTPRPGPGRPRMNREDYEDAIERTPEYEAFMAELEEFHRKQGTTLQREPVLGGKKLDIMRIYKWVMEAGGYEKVTQDRGWKKISIPFNLPSTCTNSAFVVKQAYHRNLLAYEHYKTGKTIPVGLFGSPRRDASFESSPMSPAMSALAAINTLASPGM